MEKYPNVAVKIIFKYKDRIMMFLHKNRVYDFPGGRMKYGESLLESLNRELKEELNYVLQKEPELFDVWNYIAKDKRRHSVFIYYIYHFRRKPKLSSFEGHKILWLTKKDLESGNIIRDEKFLDKIFYSYK
jgi:8-oxo-dGTP pyrophosphatase MutT (NUDIX family)